MDVVSGSIEIEDAVRANAAVLTSHAAAAAHAQHRLSVTAFQTVEMSRGVRTGNGAER